MRFKRNQKMYMVWHDCILYNLDPGIDLGNIPNVTVNQLAARSKADLCTFRFRSCRDNAGENRYPIFCADRDMVTTILGIIVVFQARMLSGG